MVAKKLTSRTLPDKGECKKNSWTPLAGWLKTATTSLLFLHPLQEAALIGPSPFPPLVPRHEQSVHCTTGRSGGERSKIQRARVRSSGGTHPARRASRTSDKPAQGGHF